jgi:hypothetical protein
MRCISSRGAGTARPLPGCCQCRVDRGTGIRREDPPGQRFVTSEPIDESCCDATGHEGPRKTSPSSTAANSARCPFIASTSIAGRATTRTPAADFGGPATRRPSRSSANLREILTLPASRSSNVGLPRAHPSAAAATIATNMARRLPPTSPAAHQPNVNQPDTAGKSALVCSSAGFPPSLSLGLCSPRSSEDLYADWAFDQPLDRAPRARQPTASNPHPMA